MSYWVRAPVAGGQVGILDFVNMRDTAVQRSIRREGIARYQPVTTAGLLTAWEVSPQPPVFFDVGANGGLYSVLCKHAWPAARVVAFEPFGPPADIAEQIAAANGLDIAVQRKAVSDRHGTGALFLSRRSDASNSLVEGFRESHGAINVELTTLDAYVASTGVVPTVVKIDVEQHEPAVIRGARQLLVRHRPVLVVEILTSRGKPRGPGRTAMEMLIGLGYLPQRLEPPADLMDRIGNPGRWRDWLFWPDRPDRGFGDIYRGWVDAVLRCTPVAANKFAQLKLRYTYRSRAYRGVVASTSPQ